MEVLNKIKQIIGDITLNDISICPIDDHITMGTELVPSAMIAPIAVSNNNNIPVIYTCIGMIDPEWLI